MIYDLTLSEAIRLRAKGSISSREVTSAMLKRVSEVDLSINAFLTVEEETALAKAECFDRSEIGDLGGRQLYGIPLAHKDMFAREGTATSFGARNAECPSDYTAEVLCRLELEGAFQFGTLNMSPYAIGPTGHNPYWGPCKNPWDTARITGGSSSGSAAAVAASMTYAALGSDTAGSIRIPAALCGITGLRPTYGRVSRFGAMPFSFSLDAIGPLARNALDCALILNAIAGYDSSDSTSAGEVVPNFAKSIDDPINGIRIGVIEPFRDDPIPQDVAALIDASLRTFSHLGCQISRSAPADFPALDAAASIILSVEGAAHHAGTLVDSTWCYSRQSRKRLERGFAISATNYVNVLRSRGAVLKRFISEMFADCDVLHMPAVTFEAPLLAECDVDTSIELDSLIDSLSRYTRPLSFLGLPVLSTPIGFSKRGLPVGMQLIGRPFQEAKLLQVAQAFQKATELHNLIAPVKI